MAASPCESSAVELLAAYRARRLSPVEAMRSVLERIERWEPHLHATYLLRPQAARDAAEASHRRWQRGEPIGPLDGVPVTIKENIATRGDPTPLGTAAAELVPAPADAPPAARLIEAGALLVCKTTMPDWGMLSSGLSSFHETARNPWNLARTPGGSSAGAAAACAAGYGPLHLGTDIGGSIRLPAGWCGVFGFKPSLGRVPIDPPYIGRVAGPITRSVADSALMMRVLSRPDARDSMSLPSERIDWEAFDRGAAPLRGLRLGLLLDAGCGLPLDDEVRTAVELAARHLEQAGAVVEPMRPFLTQEMLSGIDRFWRMRSHVDLQALEPAARARVLPCIREWADSVAGLDGKSLFRAFSQIHAMRVAAVGACAAFDYVISPTAPVAAFAAQWPSPTNDPLRALEHIGFTVPFNMSEQPAASIDCGRTRSGMPIGLQIAGQRFDDLGVLRVSRAFERVRKPQPEWPEPPQDASPTSSAAAAGNLGPSGSARHGKAAGQ